MLIPEHQAAEFDCCGPIAGVGCCTSRPKCRGGACAAWRWVIPGDENGYCGLAGIPPSVTVDVMAESHRIVMAQAGKS